MANPSARDVAPDLEAGANALAVRVATTLNNRLSTLFGAVVTRGVIENYGLVGPVVLTPYGEAGVYAQTSAPGERIVRADVLLEPDQHRVVGDRTGPRGLREGHLQRLRERERARTGGYSKTLTFTLSTTTP